MDDLSTNFNLIFILLLLVHLFCFVWNKLKLGRYYWFGHLCDHFLEDYIRIFFSKVALYELLRIQKVVYLINFAFFWLSLIINIGDESLP